MDKKELALLRENYELLKENIESLNDAKKLRSDIAIEVKKLEELAETIKQYEKEGKLPAKVEITNQPEQKEFPKEIKISNFPEQKEFPKETQISNFKDLKFPEFPKKIETQDKGFDIANRELTELRQIVSATGQKIETLIAKQTDEIFIKNKSTNEAIPVRLVDKDGNRFYNAVASAIAAGMPDNINTRMVTPNGDSAMDDTNDALRVNVVAGSTAGTQYTEGDIDATITGTAAMMEVAADVLKPIQGTVADGLLVNLGANNDVVVSGTVTEASAAAIKTAVELIDNAIAGTEMQVDVITMPVVAVTGTFWQATQPVSIAASVAVTYAALLTELQLKADLTETQPVSLASVPSHAVTNAGTFAVQAAEADGANVALGAKADAKSTATDATPVTAMQVLKQISASVQAPPSQAVTFTGSTDVATQTTLALIKAKTDNIDVALSTRTKPADAQHAIVDSGAITETNSGGIQTSVQLIDDVIYTSGDALSKTAGIAAQFDDVTPGAVTENKMAPVRMSSRREIYSQIRDAAGNERGANVNASNQLSVTVDNTVTVGSHAVTNAGTFAVQENGSQVQVDDAAFTPATSKIVMNGYTADETSTDSVDEGDGGAARMTLDRKQIMTLQPHTAGGLTTAMFSGSDGSSILVATAQVLKASAGQLYGYYAYNPEAAVTFVHFYNTAAASVTVGTTNPLFTIAIPAASAANLSIPQGIVFSNAGWSVAATTTAGGNTAPATGVSLVAWYM